MYTQGHVYVYKQNLYWCSFAYEFFGIYDPALSVNLQQNNSLVIHSTGENHIDPVEPFNFVQSVI